MLIKVKVIPNAKKNEVIKEGENFRVRLRAPASEGNANSALVELLAQYFGVKKSSIRIIKGAKNRKKIVGIQ